MVLASDRFASRDSQKELPKQAEYLRILDTIRSDLSDRGFVLSYN
jgi:hypothetical protein